mmetsp:Transcript_53620/g.135440  ORF Transcript_53620/g.135440 Transcript_53620/m.135440 type:complete len:271 (+) Transcript_53620:271-1083(+)
MGPQSHHAAMHQCVPLPAVRRLVLRDCLPDGRSGLACPVHPHPLGLEVWARVDGRVALAALGREGPVDEGEVVLEEACGDLLPGVLEAPQGLAHEQGPGGLHVQAVRDAAVAGLVARRVTIRVGAEVEEEPGLQRRCCFLRHELANLSPAHQGVHLRPRRVHPLRLRQARPPRGLEHDGEVVILVDEPWLVACRGINSRRRCARRSPACVREDRPGMGCGVRQWCRVLWRLPAAKVRYAIVLQLVAAPDIHANPGVALDVAIGLPQADAA